REDHADHQREQERLQRARRQRAESLGEELGEARPLHADRRGEPALSAHAVLRAHQGYAMATASAPTGTPMSWRMVRLRLVEPMAPQRTQRMGKSPPASTSLAPSPLNVFAITFHFSASAAIPPATIKPVAGHMIQRCRTVLKVSAGTRPARKSGSGNRTQPM